MSDFDWLGPVLKSALENDNHHDAWSRELADKILNVILVVEGVRIDWLGNPGYSSLHTALEALKAAKEEV